MKQKLIRWMGVGGVPFIVVISALAFLTGGIGTLVQASLIGFAVIAFLIGGTTPAVDVGGKTVAWYQLAGIGYLFLAGWAVAFALTVSSSPYSLLMIGGVVGGLVFLANGIDLWNGGKYFSRSLEEDVTR